MESGKPYTRKENRHFQNISNIEKCFPIIYNNCPRYIAIELENIKQCFSWKDSTPKIEHENVCNDYQSVGLKKN